jgi:hypothetical protein
LYNNNGLRSANLGYSHARDGSIRGPGKGGHPSAWAAGQLITSFGDDQGNATILDKPFDTDDFLAKERELLPSTGVLRGLVAQATGLSPPNLRHDCINAMIAGKLAVHFPVIFGPRDQ